jgi:DNA-binding NtrC family response regulator
MSELLCQTLGRRQFEVVARPDAQAALEASGQSDFDAVVTDLNMKGLSGIDLCQRLVAQKPDLPVVVITAFGSMETAIRAIRAGAYDFVTKPLEPEHLAQTLDRAVQLGTLRREVRRLRTESHVHDDGMLLGESAPMVALRGLIARIAPTDATVLITGQTGTGKEVVARSVHAQSRRAQRPFVAINCAAIPESLLEGELFGHARGAFTGATSERAGLLSDADGGTLFLDEIADMPAPLQAKLLRALEDRKVRAVGASNERAIDVRVIAATNRDVDEAVAKGTFRSDLLYRLDVVRIELPPLRARGNDVLTLAQRFIAEAAKRFAKPVQGMTSPVAAKLLAYSWPGNVRELRNCVDRAVALTSFDQITIDDLPEKIREYAPARLPAIASDDELVPLEEIERRYIHRVLASVAGNRTIAAQILCIDRKTLYRKMLRDGLIPPGTTGDE